MKQIKYNGSWPSAPFRREPDRATWLCVLLDGREDVIYRGQVLAQGDARCGRRFVCEHEHPDRDTATTCGEQWLAANPTRS